MAVKTKSELVTQSDNTFLDNTTGQIVPTNHRLWNDDVLDTMFGGIAGQRVNKDEFQNLVTNNLLIVNSIYTITNISFTNNLFGDINVLAVSGNEVMPFTFSPQLRFGICEVDTINLVNAAKALKNFGKGFTESDLQSFFTSVISAGAFGHGAEFTMNTIGQVVSPYVSINGKLSVEATNYVCQHSLTAEIPTTNQLYKGFLPELGGINNRQFFYPDHGTQDTWGDYGIVGGGLFGTLVVQPQSPYLSNITDVRGNFQKVNNMILGQIHFQADYDVQASDIFDFALPFTTASNGNLIVQGSAVPSGSNQYSFLIRGIQIIGSNTDARCFLNIVGNHNGVVTIFADLTFSYTLGY